MPPGALADFFTRRLRIASRWDYVRETLKPNFTVRLDTRLPPEVKGVREDAAVDYLHGCLRSGDVKIATAALESLSRMRDQTAVPIVIELLDHSDANVRRKLIEFLGNSKDPRAVSPLAELLVRVSPAYPEGHSDSDTSARALANIGRSEAVPALEIAIGHGVQFSCYALGELANESSVPVILDAYLADPAPWGYCDALYRLVRRSNLPVEPWMGNPTYNVEIGISKKPKWKDWWTLHREEFRVERTFAEEFPDI